MAFREAANRRDNRGGAEGRGERRCRGGRIEEIGHDWRG